MKVSVMYLLSISLLLAVFVPGCSTDKDTKHGAFSVSIVNKGTTEITDIGLIMEGAEGSLGITKLVTGQVSDYQIFVLPEIEGEIPESWGDFNGFFTQRGIVKDLIVMNYEHKFRHKMVIEINDQTYITRFPLQ